MAVNPFRLPLSPGDILFKQMCDIDIIVLSVFVPSCHWLPVAVAGKHVQSHTPISSEDRFLLLPQILQTTDSSELSTYYCSMQAL